MSQQPIYIIDGVRTPIGAFLGALSNVHAAHLGGTAIKALLERTNVPADRINEVLMGCVLPAGQGQAPARQAMRFAGIPDGVGAVTVNKVCGSGLKTVMMGATSILAGEADLVVAGGMECMSQVPYYASGARTGFRMGHQTLTDGMIYDGLWDPYDDFHMGNAGEKCADKYKFSREAQDEFSARSYHRAQDAVNSGKFKGEITPVSIPQRKGDPVVVDSDEQPFKDDPDKLAKLRPAFQRDGGTITAGNASSINDGGAALLLASEAAVKAHGLTPMAKITGSATHSQEPVWFTTAPVGAMQKLLEKLDKQPDDIDLYEINEAFAVVTMAAMEDLKLSPDKVNIHGGAVSLGHPIGASGARILVTLLHALKQTNQKTGTASLCIGGGEAVALGVELM